MRRGQFGNDTAILSLLVRSTIKEVNKQEERLGQILPSYHGTDEKISLKTSKDSFEIIDAVDKDEGDIYRVMMKPNLVNIQSTVTRGFKFKNLRGGYPFLSICKESKEIGIHTVRYDIYNVTWLASKHNIYNFINSSIFREVVRTYVDNIITIWIDY